MILKSSQAFSLASISNHSSHSIFGRWFFIHCLHCLLSRQIMHATMLPFSLKIKAALKNARIKAIYTFWRYTFPLHHSILLLLSNIFIFFYSTSIKYIIVWSSLSQNQHFWMPAVGAGIWAMLSFSAILAVRLDAIFVYVRNYEVNVSASAYVPGVIYSFCWIQHKNKNTKKQTNSAGRHPDSGNKESIIWVTWAFSCENK